MSRRVAKGTLSDGGMLQIGIKFEEAMFTKITAIAQANGMSFAAQVRSLLSEALALPAYNG